MITIALSQEEFDEFRDVQIRPRAYWPATFSCNDYKEVWPFFTHGYTRGTDRMHLHGQIPLLDEIVAIILEVRPGGGRFFIDDRGVFIEPEGMPQQQIAEFAID